MMLTYRVEIYRDGVVLTHCYDLVDRWVPGLEEMYKSVDDMPQWAQEKLAVLSLCDTSKPTPEIKEVGRRITENLFWIFKEEPDGNNPRG
jgi:hypothetical protein